MIALRKEDRAFFIFGFSKSDRDNISQEELDALKELAKNLIKMSSKELDSAVQKEILREVCYE